ncbi:hypothetical protein [Halobacillus sp. A5]|uniref:hypothetical protein n=1 Tax=Halobacillus sp. A5 TaxID=2880263 RepID=UPI0020A6D37D|nr:hypothetical protein [Halobacillus sp. A5]MCP3026823.1 hypothetical protein [Halobacillus sp. A5]
MSLQLIEVYVPPGNIDTFTQKLNQFSYETYWFDQQSDGRTLFRILSKKGNVEDLLNELEGVSRRTEGFETVLIPVRAYFSKDTITTQEEDEKQKAKSKTAASQSTGTVNYN